MALATFTDLKASIANWLHRSDLTTVIPDFIKMAESRLNRLLMLRAMEAEVPLTMTIGTRVIALPSDYSTPVAVWLETYLPRRKLTNKLPSELPVSSNVSGPPEYWAIDNTNLSFDVLADIAYAITFRYRKSYALSVSAPTNALLTNYPDVYLFGALLESAPYIEDDQRIQMWQERFDRAIKEISDEEARSRSIATLSTDINLSNRSSRFNINRGY